jgi:hypothetical protein
VLHAFRLLDAPQLKAASAVPGNDLTLIVSDCFYREVVRHDPTESALDYQPVNVNMKETNAVAWLRNRKAAPPIDPSGSPRTD